jgi:hypothetical protein
VSPDFAGVMVPADPGHRMARQHWPAQVRPNLFTGSGSKKSFHNPLKSLEYLVGGRFIDGVIHMRTPWTLSTLEAVIFSGLVLGLSGVGTWATIIH